MCSVIAKSSSNVGKSLVKIRPVGWKIASIEYKDKRAAKCGIIWCNLPLLSFPLGEAAAGLFGCADFDFEDIVAYGIS